MESLEIHEREYLATRDKTEIGYEIEIELRPKTGDNSKGFLGRYQVWAQGQKVEGDHGTEWKRGEK